MTKSKFEFRLDLAFFLLLSSSFLFLRGLEEEWIGRLYSNLSVFLLLTIYLCAKSVLGFRRIWKGNCINKYKGSVVWCYIGNIFVFIGFIFVSFRFLFTTFTDASDFHRGGVEPIESIVSIDSRGSFFGARFIFQSVNFKDDSKTYFMFQNTPVLKSDCEYTVIIAPRSGLILEITENQ